MSYSLKLKSYGDLQKLNNNRKRIFSKQIVYSNAGQCCTICSTYIKVEKKNENEMDEHEHNVPLLFVAHSKHIFRLSIWLEKLDTLFLCNVNNYLNFQISSRRHSIRLMVWSYIVKFLIIYNRQEIAGRIL